MKGNYEIHHGRPPKGDETRKAVTYRLQPSTINAIRLAAARMGISQSDYVEKLQKEAQLLHNRESRAHASDGIPTS